MNAAFLLLGAAIATPLAAFEVRRKWLDWRRAQQPFRGTPLHDGAKPYEPKAVPCITRPITTPSPVVVRDGVWHHPSGQTYWVGPDLAAGDDLCSEHGTGFYAAADHSSCGTIGGLSE